MRTTLIALSVIALCACPATKEEQPEDDGAGAETTGPRPAAEPVPKGAGETGAAAAPTCEDELAKAQDDLAACIAAKG